MKATSIPHQPPLRSKNDVEPVDKHLNTKHKYKVKCNLPDFLGGRPLVSKSTLSDILVFGA
jgi:hypothetical protein